MKTTPFQPRLLALAGLIMLAAALRVINALQLIPLIQFLSPIGAMALFGGAYFSKKWQAFLFPLLALFLSDLVISSGIYHGKYGVIYGGWYIVYGIFLLIVLLGNILLKKVTIVHVAGAGLTAALLHWGIADFMVWIGGGTDLRTMTPLTKDWSGLMQCYAQGFPFMKNFLMGNWVYGALLFGSFEWMQRRYPNLQLQTA